MRLLLSLPFVARHKLGGSNNIPQLLSSPSEWYVSFQLRTWDDRGKNNFGVRSRERKLLKRERREREKFCPISSSLFLCHTTRAGGWAVPEEEFSLFCWIEWEPPSESIMEEGGKLVTQLRASSFPKEDVGWMTCDKRGGGVQRE